MTRGCDQYKNYVDSPFSHGLLHITNENSIFDDWKYKDLISWHRYTNSNGVILEFFPDNYTVKNKNIEYKLPLPNTIDEFIINMYMLKIDLYWQNKIYYSFEPKDVLGKDDIRSYYEYILEKMDKSYELI